MIIFFPLDSNKLFFSTDTKFPTCGSGRIEPGVTCVMDEDIPVAIEFLPYIYDELYQRSVFKHCGYPSTEDKLTDQDINQLLTEKNPATVSLIKIKVYNFVLCLFLYQLGAIHISV